MKTFQINAVKFLMLFIFSFIFFTLHAVAQKSAMDLVKEAKQQIENLPPEKAQEELSKENVVLIDIREANELKEQGKIPGSVHAPRGMLEFYADSTLPYYKPAFGKEKRIILYCASSGRSALAVQTLKNMGYKNVTHIDGGFKAWKEAGLAVEE